MKMLKTYWDPNEEEDNQSGEPTEEQVPDRDDLDLDEDIEVSKPPQENIPTKPKIVRGFEDPTWP